ncbi:MAG: 6,7-dimethyl-8-ribityllumazine synthase [Ignavibacteria bacterium]|nr:6,7-dimethyl-8-ribityllumazine synthase [Ignavibacteria bacterium]
MSKSNKKNKENKKLKDSKNIKDSKKRSARIAIIVSKFNDEVTSGLLKGAVDVLKENNYHENGFDIYYVPGAFEIPLTAKQLCINGRYCGIICLGAVIKGETAHFEYISETVSNAIMTLNMTYSTPVSFGILTCYTDEQALNRSNADENNKGKEAAKAVLDMIKLLKEI